MADTAPAPMETTIESTGAALPHPEQQQQQQQQEAAAAAQEEEQDQQEQEQAGAEGEEEEGGGDAASVAASTGAKGPVEFEPPAASVTKIIKRAVGDSVQVGKEAKATFTRAAGIFILYLTACANDLCREGRRTTISANDVYQALRELDFEEFVGPLQTFLANYNEAKRSQKDSGKQQQQGAAAGGGKKEGEQEGEQQQAADGKEGGEEQESEQAAMEQEETAPAESAAAAAAAEQMEEEEAN